MCTPLFIIALFTVAKVWKQPTCPLLDERVRRCEIHTCHGLTNAMDMNLGKLWEMVRVKQAWRAAIHGVAKSRT